MPSKSECHITDPFDIIKLVTTLPNLEDISLCYPYYKTEDRQSTKAKEAFSRLLFEKKRGAFPSSVQRLSWPIFSNGLFKLYNNIDSITVFDAFGTPGFDSSPLAIPPFPTLSTLALNQCTWSHIEPLFEQCVDTSPRLVNLIRDLEGNVPPTKLPKLLARFTRVELFHKAHRPQPDCRSKLTFQMIIQNAPHLRHFLYYHPYDGSYGMPWNWFEQHVLKVDTYLKTIEFWPEYTRLEKWCKLQRMQDFVANPYSLRSILEKVVCGTNLPNFVVDVSLLLKKVRSMHIPKDK